jgi:hypothetical protein
MARCVRKKSIAKAIVVNCCRGHEQPPCDTLCHNNRVSQGALPTRRFVKLPRLQSQHFATGCISSSCLAAGISYKQI